MRLSTLLLSAFLLSAFLLFPACAQTRPRPVPRPLLRVLPTSKTAPKLTKPSASATKYAARLNALNAQMQPQLAALWRDLERTQTALKPPRRRAPTVVSDDVAVDDVPKDANAALSFARGALLDSAARLRPFAKKLRALSPVPRSLKRADENFVDASFELDQALNVIVLYARSPNHETENRASRLLRRAINDLDAGLLLMARATDAQVRAKNYVND